MKFVLENGILTDTPYEFLHYAGAADAPLAQKLLMLRYVERVMLNQNYVTVLKTQGSAAWDELLPEVRGIIQSHLESNEPILYLGVQENKHRASTDPLAEMVMGILNKMVRPAAMEDGGDILFEGYEDGVLTLSMHGACHKCPFISVTIRDGVEPLLRELTPEIREIRLLQPANSPSA